MQPVRELRGRREGLRYLAQVPRAAHPGSGYPFLLFLHGAGERGDPNGSELNLVKRHGPWCSPGADEFFILAPQCPRTLCWPAVTDKLIKLVQAVVRGGHGIDPARCFATGLGMGGFGVWSLAWHCPPLFQAIVPIAGGVCPPLPSKAKLAHVLQQAQEPPVRVRVRVQPLRHLRVWLFHGAEDKQVSKFGSTRVFRALGGKGRGAARLRLTVYKDAKHSCWKRAYDDPGLLSWLLVRRRLRSKTPGPGAWRPARRLRSKTTRDPRPPP